MRLGVSLEKPGGPKPPGAEGAALPAQPDGSRLSADAGQAFLTGGQMPTGFEELYLLCVPQHITLKENPLYFQVSGSCHERQLFSLRWKVKGSVDP